MTLENLLDTNASTKLMENMKKERFKELGKESHTVNSQLTED
jgi:hypothetical protein